MPVRSATCWNFLAVVPLTHGDVIRLTDFTGRNISGATASDITYTTNGVANPGNLTARHSLVDNGLAVGYLRPNFNTDTGGN